MGKLALDRSLRLIQNLGSNRETTMAAIGTVIFLAVVGIPTALLIAARLNTRAAYRKQMTDNAMRSMGN
ncbi:hypothetical protein H8B02_17715 [Bradyrhizobium sp. Pear77]|uniref:hypothetical protein n=1 Tax=Bradyrhizobium altum TaxID=1571202 RepID=UPI001E2E7679|nr:hypothetical protein [Bradyrhizobium altum]MCC8955205.1 hypothetical protein [Bradyrhizobium altum]